MSTPAHAPAPTASASGARADLRPLALAVVIPIVVALILTLFVWPALRAAPQGLDLAVVGSPATVEELRCHWTALDPARST